MIANNILQKSSTCAALPTIQKRFRTTYWKKAVKNNYSRQLKRIHYYDRLQLETISGSDLLPPRIKAQAAKDLIYYPRYSNKNTETDKDAITCNILGCVNDYKINRVVFRDNAHKGLIPNLKFWRYPNYSRWDKEKLMFRLLLLQHDPYYKDFTDKLCAWDEECDEIRTYRLKALDIDCKANDYVWCMRRNYTPDKYNEDYRF